MRLLIVPFILVAVLAQAPVALSNNQEAAERIAGIIGNAFPDADVEVAFQGGRVWLRGEAVSQEQRGRIIAQARNIPGLNVTEVNEEIQVVAPRTVPALAAQTLPPANSALARPAPIPQVANAGQRVANQGAVNQGAAVPMHAVGQNARQPQMQQQQAWTADMLPAHPQQHFPAAYGMRPGQQTSMHPFMPIPYAPMAQHHNMHQHATPHAAQQQQMMQQHAAMMHQMMQQQAMQHGHHGHGPMPGQFNHPNLPDYAWPAYANYPNFAQVSYPRSYSPNAWPYIGPFYPYPQVPLGWRKVTLEHSNGWWWLDFDNGATSGPFSALFRHPTQYRY